MNTFYWVILMLESLENTYIFKKWKMCLYMQQRHAVYKTKLESSWYQNPFIDEEARLWNQSTKLPSGRAKIQTLADSSSFGKSFNSIPGWIPETFKTVRMPLNIDKIWDAWVA